MENNKITEQEANEKIKELASNQKIELHLTEEQLNVLKQQWKEWDHSKPAEISFVVDGNKEVNMKLAAYSYSGSSCCA